MAVGKTREVWQIIEKLGLNNPKLVEFRKGYIRLWDSGNDDFFRYPVDTLVDLSTLSTRNSKPEGIKLSAYHLNANKCFQINTDAICF